MPGETSTYTSSGSTPVPDPTTLTTQQMQREIAALKEVVFTRLDAMDKAVDLFKADLVRVPTDTDKQVGNLREFFLETFKAVEQRIAGLESLTNEKFAGIQQQFSGNSTALAAALQAQKEAAGEQTRNLTQNIEKSETSTKEQITKQGELLNTRTEGLLVQVNDLKNWRSTMEGLGLGRTSEVGERRATATDYRGSIAMYVGIAAIAIALADVASRFKP